ncbi:hypothetical protein So717_17110 [Roseobacter cerasinus]|uniref:DUF4214 domain-containing protein n=1 Tax=Roseobacter cerasinus TaxID=2602289 RepID=A0A640VNC4_9RHOB|nr:FG-GAP-like repeat-containing protein [Roseobacter cerasinus]GFE49958.1 hypothetical protein So717_17110 [Roseobacter cerasinus]
MEGGAFFRVLVPPGHYRVRFAAGTRSFVDGSGVLQTVQHSTRIDDIAKARILNEAAQLYDTIFDRAMDFTEVEQLVRFVQDGQLDMHALASDLLASDEFQVRNGTMLDVELITLFYRNSYDRKVSLFELDTRLTGLGNGSVSAAELAVEIARSAEHTFEGNTQNSTNNYDVFLNGVQFDRSMDLDEVRDQIGDIIRVAHGRRASNAELDLYDDYLIGGTHSVQDVAYLIWTQQTAFPDEPDSTLGLSQSAFIDRVFVNAFGRAPTAQEHSTWATHLNNGTITGLQMLVAVANSFDVSSIDFDASESAALFAGNWSITSPATGGQVHNGNFGDFDKHVGDVNGDGLADAVWTKSDLNGLQIFTSIGNGDGTYQDAVGNVVHTGAFGNFASHIDDVNGDGFDDTIWSISNLGGLQVWVSFSDGDGSFGTAISSQPSASRFGTFDRLIADINGDNKTDVLWTKVGNGIQVYSALGKGDGTFHAATGQVVHSGNFGDFEAHTADVNGDGQVDLVYTKADLTGLQVYTALGTSSGSFQQATGTNISTGAFDDRFEEVMSDVNGDGFDDAIFMHSNGNGFQVYVGLSNGDGTFAQAQGTVTLPENTGSWDNYQKLSADFNADGFDDAVWMGAFSSGLYRVIAFSHGDGTFSEAVGGSVSQAEYDHTIYYATHADDVNGDSIDDLIWSTNVDGLHVYSTITQEIYNTEADTFVFNGGQGEQSFFGYEDGLDTIAFSGDVTWGDLTLTHSQNNVRIDIGGTTDSLTIVGAGITLTEEDFLFV